MLGNCIIRNPTTRDGNFDKGSLCESLLFFGSVHLVIDLATLGAIIQANFLEDLIPLLKAGYLTANYSPQAPVLITENKNGLREHFFTVIRITGDPNARKLRNVDQLETQLMRLIADKGAARKYCRQLADLISFKNLENNGVPELSRSDITDPKIAKEIARMALRSRGIPENQIKFSNVHVVPLENNKFAISTDIDFDYLRQFLPEGERATFSQNDLFPAIGDARFDIGIAASQSAAFVGNEKNEAIVNMILERSLGAQFNRETVSRQIYDFISVSTPTIREAINSGERTPQEFIRLIEKASPFQKWLQQQNPNSDLVTEMLREKSQADWLESLPVKAMRFGLFKAIGNIADFASPGASIVTDSIDTFLVERLGKSWRPHYFVENNLRGFLDRP